MNDASAVEALFFAALAKGTAAERAAFLDSACADDAELRRQVEKLLLAHPKDRRFPQQACRRATGRGAGRVRCHDRNR